jgi:hypothetical protein
MQLPKRREKNFLDQIIYFTRRNARQQNSVHHARVAIVKPSEGGAVPPASRVHKPVVIIRLGHRPGVHNPTFSACGSEVNCVFHISAIQSE